MCTCFHKWRYVKKEKQSRNYEQSTWRMAYVKSVSHNNHRHTHKGFMAFNWKWQRKNSQTHIHSDRQHRHCRVQFAIRMEMEIESISHRIIVCIALHCIILNGIRKTFIVFDALTFWFPFSTWKSSFELFLFVAVTAVVLGNILHNAVTKYGHGQNS